MKEFIAEAAAECATTKKSSRRGGGQRSEMKKFFAILSQRRLLFNVFQGDKGVVIVVGTEHQDALVELRPGHGALMKLIEIPFHGSITEVEEGERNTLVKRNL